MSYVVGVPVFFRSSGAPADSANVPALTFVKEGSKGISHDKKSDEEEDELDSLTGDSVDESSDGRRCFPTTKKMCCV